MRVVARSFRRCVAIAPLALVTLGGCGGHAAGVAAARRAYLGELSNGLIYLEWTASGRQLSGTLAQIIVRPQGHGRESVGVEHAVLTGTLIGDGLIMSINGAENIAGMFHGPQLLLDYPGPQNAAGVGTVLIVNTRPATAADYASALAALRTKVAVRNADISRR